MKQRILYGLFGVLAVFIAHDATAQGYESILSYHSDIVIDSTHTITVTETIKVYAAGERIKRGIYRVLPASRNINGSQKRIHYHILSVTKNGREELYKTKRSSGNFMIYLGEDTVFLAPGVYIYELKYTASNQIGFFTGYDELYWNVNGTDWEFDIKEISATVTIPAKASIIQYSCYTGAYGSRAQNCKATENGANVISWEAGPLYGNEGFTIALGFSKGVVQPPLPPTWMEQYGMLIFLTIIFLALCIYCYTKWKQYGIDPASPTIYPQYEAPEKLSPASTGIILTEYDHDKFLTASIVNLAVKGYLHINEQTSKTLGIFKTTLFELQKLKDADDSLPIEEKILFEKLFSRSDIVAIDGKYNSQLKSAVTQFKRTLQTKHKKLISKGNNIQYAIWPGVLTLLVFIAAQLYNLLTAPDFEPAFLLLLFIGIPVVIMFVVVSYLWRRYESFWIVFCILSMLLVAAFIVIALADAAIAGRLNLYASVGFLIVSFIVLSVFVYFIRRPSEEKLHLQSLIKGFKMYMGTAEENQLQHFNPPQLTPEVFEKLLPYAMVLGVSKIWGEKFQHILSNTTVGEYGYSSGWYSGQSFSPVLMGSLLGNSLGNAVSNSSTPPSSGSGSGGGGFSGGGGGGGGGGGW